MVSFWSLSGRKVTVPRLTRTRAAEAAGDAPTARSGSSQDGTARNGAVPERARARERDDDRRGDDRRRDDDATGTGAGTATGTASASASVSLEVDRATAVRDQPALPRPALSRRPP